jgi:hypothetical protein
VHNNHMVVQRTLAKIEELKERPHHERRALAAYGGMAVSGLLLLSWGFFSINNLSEFGSSGQSIAQNQNVNAQAASVAGAFSSSEPAPALQVASSSNGRVELVPVQ